ncbi:MAG: CRTAC1 family protein [Bacteroidota bacterium]
MLTSSFQAYFLLVFSVFGFSACQKQAPETSKDTVQQSVPKPEFVLRWKKTVTGSPVELAACDFNNDGYPDILVATDEETRIFKNQKNYTFEEKTVKSDLPTDYTCGITVADLNFDGYLDVWMPPKVYDNQRDFTFVEREEGRLVGYDCELDDPFENSYYNIYRRSCKSEFSEYMSFDVRLGGFKRSLIPFFVEQNPSQFVEADFDRDGDRDVLLLTKENELRVFETLGKTNYLKLRLIGEKDSYYGIGTIAIVEAGGQQQFLRNLPQHATGITEPFLLFDLGGAQIVDKLTIHWLDCRTQTFEGLSANQELSISQIHAK